MIHRCESFAEQGCTGYATSRRKRLVMDVTSDDNVRLVVQSILQEQGKIDIVVNNAGAIAIGPLLDLLKPTRFSILRVAKAVIPSMVEQKQGLVINIGSCHSMEWIICAAKAGTFGVKVMLVAPSCAANLELSSTSIFKAYFDRVYERMHISQEAKGACLQTNVARSVVAKALGPNPPSYMTLGAGSGILHS
ncbi:uncharacterized protein EDB91DRAFT_1233217 [Suillus paluster]|uniref:uncharacterized protein n=1 Tax=Suillus paluster TaxID=48578 RepID=UPI001B86E724|nr:uncharacterized protein EDB91DRAFT_1233217 [Suillus paluster]KAG1756392.1 hypothetical protein EDB91DRAFT_1233217 [Suillus paluster]